MICQYRRPARLLPTLAIRASAFMLLLSLLAACAQGPVGPGGTVHLTFTASPGLNPGPGGTPNPAQVRIYALKSRDKFLNTDYFQLADKDKAILGSDLLFRQDITVRPGATQTIDTTVLPGQQLIGLAVAYRNIDHATWRLPATLQAAQSFTLGPDAIAASR